MESPFPITATYIPSQSYDRLPVMSSNGLDPPRDPALASSGFRTELTNYNTSQPPSSSVSQYCVPRFPNFRLDFHDLFAPSTLIEGQRIPTTGPASDSPYGSFNNLGFQAPAMNYLEQSSFALSQGPIPTPTTMQTYQINNSIGPVLSRFPYIRPMPFEGLNENSLAALSHRSKFPIEVAARTSNREAQLANVVGQQGRRGILPSAAGRPAAMIGETVTGQKSTNTPVKDANGKFACEYCPKVYLHAKHLKRHLLRHTGTRPYSCGLCEETFSRSDILKRHFQKCSLRRGNPTGENHLAHSRQTKRSNLEAAGKVPRGRAAVLPSRTPSVPSGQSKVVGDPAPNNFQQPFDFNTLDLAPPSLTEGQQPLSKQESCSNNVKRPSTGGAGGSVSNLYISAPSSYDPTSINYSGQITPESITTSGAATPYQYQHDLRVNQFSSDTSFAPGIAMPAAPSIPHGFGALLPNIVGSSHDRGNDLDWSIYFPGQGLDQYAQPPFHPVDGHDLLYRTGDDSVTIKMEPDPNLVMPKPVL